MLDNVTLLGIAVALGMDTFAVAGAISATVPTFTARHSFRLTWHFGLFQAMMTILGWYVGSGISDFMSRLDHWIAFGLLTLLGIKMIYESRSNEETRKEFDPTRGRSLVYLSVATSIDALAVGLSFSLIGIPVAEPALLIGFTACVMTFVGIRLGLTGRAFLGKWAEVIGGFVLICIGLRILIEHLTS